MKRILAINPGATSTKIAVYDNRNEVFKEIVEHQGDDLKKFKKITDQFQYRLDLIVETVRTSGIELNSLDAIVARGGLLKPLEGGTYLVNEDMVNDLKSCQRGEHASNLGAIIAYDLSEELKIPSFIVDPVSVDEMNPEARISGMPEIPRISMSHALNSKAVARKVAEKLGKEYEDMKFVVVHLGTGISVTAHEYGKMIDVNNAQEEGPFSPDRTGTVPVRELVKLCYSGKYKKDEILKKISGSGGIYALAGTKDIRELEERINNGDKKAEIIFKAMIYQISKEIGAMSTVLKGYVDKIVITGGIAHSKKVINLINERVSFIAPIVVIPGEEELESLVNGALRVVCSEEKVKYYK
jgi:butyrate kinase